MIRPYDSVMLRTLLGPLVASLQLFGLYVVIHGHYSPGGGFQGGVLLACSLILPVLVYGPGKGLLVLSMRGAMISAAVGVMIFAGVGVAAAIFGAPVMDYSALPIAADRAVRRSLGILLIEVGVTLAVAGSMVAIFYALYQEHGSDQGRSVDQ